MGSWRRPRYDAGAMRASLLLGAMFCLGCAVGEEVDEEGYGGAAGFEGFGAMGGSTATGGGGWATGGASTGGAWNGGTGGSGATGGSGTGATGGTGAAGGSGATGGTGGTGGSSTGGTGGTCAASNTCASAQDLGSMSGDSGAGTVTTTGSGSKWLKVRVTEDSSSVFGQKMALQLSLTVPSGADYDLYAYVNTGSDVSACGSSPAKKSDAGGTGANEQLSLSWGEGTVANGDDDSRTVSIEIKHKSGSCDGSATWKLIGAGN